MIRYAWRLIRPHVYSTEDYTRLIETRPEELTFREVKEIQAILRIAGAFDE